MLIYAIHYVCFNFALSSLIVLITIFLRAHAPETSLTEIGCLLMVLPFISILVKPLFCALADRRQAHKKYLMIFMGTTGIAYGLLTVPTFFPDFIKAHARLVWYFYVVCILIGYSAFAVAFSLGDALSMNRAAKQNMAWGTIRVWGVVAWGIGGYGIGLINETPILPIYVPGLLINLVVSLLEVVILFFWPNDDFDMSDFTSTDNGLDMNSINCSQLQHQGQTTKAGDDCSQMGAEGSIATTTTARSPIPPYPLPAHMDQFDVNSSTLRRNAQFGSGMSFSKGSLASSSLNPRMVKAIANIVVGEVGEGLKSSLRLGSNPHSKQRPGLSDLIGRETLANITQQANLDCASNASMANVNGNLDGNNMSSGDNPDGLPMQKIRDRTTSKNSFSGSIGRAALQTTKFGMLGMSSISSATGKTILEELKRAQEDPAAATAAQQEKAADSPSQTPLSGTPSTVVGAQTPTDSNPILNIFKQQQQPDNGPATGSLRRHGADMARNLYAASRGTPTTEDSIVDMQGTLTRNNNNNNKGNSISRTNSTFLSNNLQLQQHQQQLAGGFKDPLEDQKKMAEDLQMVLLKIIIKRDPAIIKYLIVFTITGALLFIHLTYFFMHAEHYCHKLGMEFSSIAGYYLLAHMTSEMLAFLIVARYYIPKVGRLVSFMTAGFIFLYRYGYYATYFEDNSPYWAIATETSHGFAYGIVYSLMSDIALESVNQLDEYLPELIELGLVDPRVDPDYLKLPLRATMQGIFSGAFDGLGNGLGVVAGGILLDYYSYQTLWAWCSALAIGLVVIYPLTEWHKLPCFNKEQRNNNNNNNNKNQNSNRPTAIATTTTSATAKNQVV